MLENSLQKLKRDIIEYADFVQSMIDKSIRGLRERNKELLVQVIEEDEPIANEKEIEIDDAVVIALAQFQPAAKNLRTLLTIGKINNDLERIGDHAVNIAQRALYLILHPEIKRLVDIPKMAETSICMLKDSVASFIQQDGKLGRDVCIRDNIVDELNVMVMKDLIAIMQKDSDTIERAINLLIIAKNLERIADLSTNIGEDVMFMVEGKIIKHMHSDDDIEKNNS